MKIQLLVAIGDKSYMEHLSGVLSEKYAEVFEVSICSTEMRLQELLDRRQFDIALLDPELADRCSLSAIRMPLLIWDGSGVLKEQAGNLGKIRKYQRISKITSELLGRYAQVSNAGTGFADTRARVTAVWSPAGGCGKTTVALAYAAQLVSQKKKTVYLDLEPFSSTPAYFASTSKGLSSVFEQLDGNVEMMLQSIRQEDTGSGILYFGHPDNYEDIEILTVEDVTALVRGAASGVEELVVDLGSTCDQKVRKILELADKVLLVVDDSPSSQIKCSQFRQQHNLYTQLADKLTVVVNRGGRHEAAPGENVISLPRVQSNDPVVVYKTLSAGYFT